MMMDKLTAQAITFQYTGSRRLALDQLNLRIPAGKRTVICGHNGSGKSTLFLHLLGLLRPESGEFRLDGKPYKYVSKALQGIRERIGLLFQDPEQQLIYSTPYDDISYGLRNAGVEEAHIHIRVKRILDQMNLTELAELPIHHLSLGQKKRVALAGILVMQPEILILDEPTAYLDRQSERLLLEELERVHHNGMTVVMATHDMNLAYAWADNMIIMDRGRCVMAGSPLEIFEKKDDITAYGLEQPIVLELWDALPEALRSGHLTPRTVEELKTVIGQLNRSVPESNGTLVM